LTERRVERSRSNAADAPDVCVSSCTSTCTLKSPQTTTGHWYVASWSKTADNSSKNIIGVWCSRAVSFTHVPVLFPNSIVNRVRTVWQPQIWRDKIRCFLLKELDYFTSAVRRCTVLLEHKRVASNAKHDRQHLLL